MRIWILRHGQAEPMAASDPQRALTEHGRAEVRAMLPLFDDTPLDVILASPYRRAQQTAELVSRGLAHARGVATAAWLTPDDDPRQALDFLGERSERNVLLVSHQPLVGQRIRTLREHLPGTGIRVAAIFRREQPIMPDGDTVIEADDEVFFIAARPDIRQVMAELRRLDRPYKRIIIAGGGNIGARLATSIEGHYQVKIIEQDLARCEHLSQQLRSSTILHGSASDRELLIEENIEATDVFIALTNDEEANVMASMLAKKLGARTVITLINNPAYVDLVQGGLIDIALSPQQSTISALLSHVRRGDVVAVHSLRRGAAEALEAIAHGDVHSSRVVGRRVNELALPEGASVAAVVRGDDVIMAYHDTVIAEGDHVILFVADKRAVRAVEKLFQLGIGFF